VLPEASSVPEPSAFPPSVKVTVPVGWPLAPAATEALSVIELPSREGVRLEVSVTVLLASTIWLKTGEVLAVLFESPL